MKAPKRSDHRESDSPKATRALGESLGRALIGQVVIALVGPLGAGKTQLVKGIAKGNTLDDVCRVTSPTFTLLHEYPGRLTLYHLDAYRLPDSPALLALGFEELIRIDSAVVVEWADRVSSVLGSDVLWIEAAVTSETSRRFSFSPTGDVSRSFWETWQAAQPH